MATFWLCHYCIQRAILCSIRFNIPSSAICPHTVFMCPVWFSQQMGVISPYIIGTLVVLLEAFCVFCEVGAECSYRTIVSKVMFQKFLFSMLLVLCIEDAAMLCFPNTYERESMNLHIPTRRSSCSEAILLQWNMRFRYCLHERQPLGHIWVKRIHSALR